ncbi:hypothetical protein [Glutamicibacter sp. BW80]|uniref:hypothetical protein n=1 Tax=Glutamicibacter sp. BW80 TaxID=2024404 RepID=UPI000BB754E8|nr:hypothetical protein [Glutamicibacter sp. BW80]
MSFIFGGVDTNSLAGVTATLAEWPSLGGLSLETEDTEGRDARYFYGASQSHTAFTFDVLIEGSTPEQAAERRDNFVGLIAPHRGAQSLIAELDTAWQWWEVMVSGQIDWRPCGWHRGKSFTLRADVSFETVGDAAAMEAEQVPVSFASSLSFTLDRGNTVAYPQIEFPSGAQATVKVGGFEVVVSATTSGRTNVLDYQAMEFYQKDATTGARLASIVRFMSHFRRASLTPGQTVSVSVPGAPTGSRRLYANARRI